jgi:integrase
MARKIERLSAKGVKNLKTVKRHADGGGLYAKVRPDGSKSWVFLFELDHKTYEMGGGPVSDVSLKEARAWAAENRAMLRETPPRNPLTVRREQQRISKTPTFREMVEVYLTSKSGQWRNALHTREVANSLRNCALGSMPVDQIRTSDVLNVLRPTLERAPVLARRYRARIEAVLNVAMALGHLDGDRRNPAQWRGCLDHLMPKKPKVEHHHALDYRELPGFVARLRGLQRGPDGSYAVGSFCLEFTILTAARSNEARRARWEEINFETRTWNLPAGRMKSNRAHIVPLSEGALSILETMRSVRASQYVFPGVRDKTPLGEQAMRRLLKDMDIETTVHGFRSSFRDWSGDMTHFPREVCEAAMAHVTGDSTERSYRRGHAIEKHRELLDAWNSYLAQRSDNVVRMKTG